VDDTLKKDPCKDCDRTFPPECMDFDHRPGEVKIQMISHIINRGNKQAILDEVKKCDLICACCHRIRTKRRLREQKEQGKA
jgi:hypothetical protein